MMEQCAYCEWMETKKNLIYEDEQAGVALFPQPASAGHLLVIPKKHVTILEQLPALVAEHIGIIANKFSMIQFETLEPLGTNLIIPNGLAAGQTMPHVGIHLIPRYDKDGIDLSWKSRPLGEEEMAAVELGLREQLQSQAHAQSHDEGPAPAHQAPAGHAEPAKKEESQKTMLKWPDRIA